MMESRYRLVCKPVQKMDKADTSIYIEQFI